MILASKPTWSPGSAEVFYEVAILYEFIELYKNVRLGNTEGPSLSKSY